MLIGLAHKVVYSLFGGTLMTMRYKIIKACTSTDTITYDQLTDGQ